MSRFAQSNLLTIMDDFFDDMYPAKITKGRLTTVPAINVHELGDSYSIKLYIPGLEPKDVKIQLVDQVLNISYDHEEQDIQDEAILRQEYSHFSFSRSLQLPKDVDNASIKAKSKNGVLTIEVKKRPETQPKTVNIDIE